MMSLFRLFAWIDLPQSISPELAGLIVGATVGVIGFLLVLLFVGRGDRRRSRRSRPATGQVVLLPSYEAPLPSQIFDVLPARGFAPSTALSARAFAKMGSAADESAFFDSELLVREMTPPATPAVTVSPVVMISAAPPATMASATSADESASQPLGGILKHAASISDLSFDDGPTEIGEPCFEPDEMPQPRRRTDPPGYGALAASSARFSQ